jgi:hypothetical protein
VQVSNLIVDCPEIQRLDIHPLLASGNEFTALDVTLTSRLVATAKVVSRFALIRNS